jgi:hypothetical protein
MNVFWGSLACWSRFCLFLLRKYLMNLGEILLVDVHVKRCRAELLLLVRIGPVYPNCIKINHTSVEIHKTVCN